MEKNLYDLRAIYKKQRDRANKDADKSNDMMVSLHHRSKAESINKKIKHLNIIIEDLEYINK